MRKLIIPIFKAIGLDVFNQLRRGRRAAQVPLGNNLCKQLIVHKLNIANRQSHFVLW